jgi:hypothetical protein
MTPDERELFSRIATALERIADQNDERAAREIEFDAVRKELIGVVLEKLERIAPKC